jgi:F420-dependent oxidoreductase-like protein
MKLGVQINRFDYPGGEASIGQSLAGIAQAADTAGFYSAWVMDHFFQLPNIGDYTDPMLEAYTTLGYLAGMTQNIKLGTLVTGVIYREPAVLIKAVTTLDVLSSGRAYFGIGAGWNDQEAKALGLLDPLNSQRFDRLEDTLKLARQMWGGDFSQFTGKVYSLPEPHLSPMSVTKPHPPILVGGGGEQKTLRYVAKYGDACNLSAADTDTLVHKLGVLQQHCVELGRPFEEIEKTAVVRIDSTTAAQNPQGLLEKARELRGIGIDHMTIMASRDANPSSYEALRPVVQALGEL